MKTFKNLIWIKEKGFGVLKTDNGFIVCVEIIEGVSRPYKGIAYHENAEDSSDVQHFDFESEEQINDFLELVQAKEAVAA